jgi:diguanylate cyclase (GGDEF)-like protein/PAS domain S-box-containing protein
MDGHAKGWISDRFAGADASALVTGMLEAAPVGMLIADPRGAVLAGNRLAAEIFGVDPVALAGTPLATLLGGVDFETGGAGEIVAGSPNGAATPGPGSEPRRATATRADGSEVAVEIWSAPIGASETLSIAVRDASERDRIEDRLRELSDTDPLTGLANRRRLEADAERELARAARYGGGALLILGLDNFKRINEAFGYRHGDELLREIGAVITERIRETDVAARLSGDTFAVVLTEVSVERARSIGDDMLQMLGGHRFEPEGSPVMVAASGGVIGLADGPADVSEALSWAELAMRRAKAMGGGRIVAFEDSLLPERESGMTWSERIRAALDSDAFVPHFQPILELSSGSVNSWEVLIRMLGEEGEVIGPDSFVPTAERYGLIQELDRWVVRNAIAAMRAHDERGLSLEINLSGKSIGDPEMLSAIRSEIEASGVDPRRLVFEVTETAAIANLEQAARFGRELLDLGCGFALDDFGTGFASFYYLKRLPLTHLKIDGDFIRGLASSPVDQLVVKAIVEIADGMGLETIAEYVEDAATIELLREFGVDYCQGFEIGRPAAPQPPDLVPPPHEDGG